ncbi:class C sortase [Mediterraneibacter glycyrrhizinilyticus]|uniref:class C sortase n=1 Tax=Mediterraneibacter glycyrrhizinilyticus TaxID=342942 RepID=UPI0025A3315D|nr:class C sortase [Mediterraneibacter glycyrrhizinilyticus]MDM8126411.1 class C sortase [Mediterraneibacter glycyrrhizinilyticus]
MKQKILTILAILVFLAGISLLAYPAVSNLLYEKEQEELMEHYDSIVGENLTADEQAAELQECREYNRGLLQGGVLLTDPFDMSQLDPSAMPYAGLLNVDQEGGMAYLRIPAIDVELMIYHGTEEEVLQKGVGHLQGSSLPVGGTGTHCVLSAHTGLNDKKLFTDLDQLENGDIFYIHVLGEILAYQVDQIRVVLPEETEDLKINAQEDYVTLVTCTPYGINTHRLLVRGIRVPYEEEREQSEGTLRKGSWLEQYRLAAFAGLSVVLAAAAGGFLWRRVRKKR